MVEAPAEGMEVTGGKELLLLRETEVTEVCGVLVVVNSELGDALHDPCVNVQLGDVTVLEILTELLASEDADCVTLS